MNFVMLNLLFRISFRNLQRNKRRTILTLLIIASTLATSLVASRYAVAVMDLWKDGTVDTGTGHVQIHAIGYKEKQEGLRRDTILKMNLGFEAKLVSDPRVEAKVRRLRFEGLVIGDRGSTYFLGCAVEPLQELAVSPRMYNPPFDQGSFVKESDESSVVIGRALADTLKLKIGDSVTLLAQTVGGSANGWDVRVDGILDVPLPNFSKHAIYMNLSFAQKFIRLADGYNEMALRLRDNVDIREFIRDFQEEINTGGAEVEGWWQVEPLILKIESIWNIVAGLLCTLLILSAVLSVINVIYMIVNERVIEIGTLMAIGVSSKTIAFLFAGEGLIMGLVGGLVGMLLGNILIGLMSVSGIPFESPFGSGYEIIHPQVNLTWSILSVTISSFLSGLCAIPPAIKSTKIEPALAFRGVT